MSRYNAKWERAETLAAFNLYCRMPFSRVHSRNPVIVALAKKMDRTPASLSMKMGNLAWHDPKNPSSLRRGSKLDAKIWAEFFADSDKLIYESEQAFASFDEQTAEERAEVPPDIINMPKSEERERLVRARVNQSFFRRAVLSAYGEKCCITGLRAPELLNASHIIPWRKNRERINPSNGLCLNALHDRAFDRGLITVRADLSVAVSGYLRDKAQTSNDAAFIIGCDGGKISAPDKFKPSAEFLDYHNKEIFVGE